MNKVASIPLIFVVIVSGCSIPGLPGFGGGETGQYANDIIIIKDQSVFPQSVKADQEITLVTYIQNLGERNAVSDVVVNLFDTCNVFNKITIDRPASCEKINEGKKETGCKNVKLLPKEVKEIRWKLVPDKTAVKVPIPSCKLKVSVSYPYKTSSQTEIYFINSEEAQRQEEQRGSISQKTSTHKKSEGPIEAYVIPDKNVRQPIPTTKDQSYFPASLYVENVGSGFLWSRKVEGKSITGILGGDLTITIDGEEILKKVKGDDCSWTVDNDDAEKVKEKFETRVLTLIGKKSPPFPCKINVPTDVTTEKTSRISVDFKTAYTYEFRKESSVTIEPVGYEPKPAAADGGGGG